MGQRIIFPGCEETRFDMTEKEWREDFGRNLASLMFEAGLTQNDLAEMTGVTQSDISRYISGDQIPNAITIVNLSYALSCDYDDLIDFGEHVAR